MLILKSVFAIWNYFELRIFNLQFISCGSSSVVERHLAKVEVAGSSPVSRSL